MNAVKFQTFPANTAGRDFVVGDIHGAFDMVVLAMRRVAFNAALDRLFCVGDLIDRSQGSHRALEFLAKPYVVAIQGNHDHDFCSLSLDEIKVLGGVNWNGLGWVLQVSDEKLLALQAKLAALPIAIEVATRRGSVGLVHGDVPAGMGWQTFVQALQRGEEKVIETALWGRDRLQAGDTSGVSGIGRVFVGHTVQWGGPKRLGNVYAIDTGAVFREIGHDKGSLTMADLTCRTSALRPFSLDEAQALSGQGHVALHGEPGCEPFGIYS